MSCSSLSSFPYSPFLTFYAERLPDENKPNSVINEKDIEAGKNLKVFIGHSVEDAAANYEEGLKAKETLLKPGYDIIFHNFKGEHVINVDVPGKQCYR